MFDRTVEGKRILSGIYVEKLTFNMHGCMSLCVLSPECQGVNFCGGRLCQLLADSTSALREDVAHCVVRLMSRHIAPVCSEETREMTLKDIQNPDAGLCNIQQKRSDADLDHGWKLLEANWCSTCDVWSRRCRPASHGGVPTCWDGYLLSNQKLLISFDRSESKLNASQAESFCYNSAKFHVWAEMNWPLGDLKWMANLMNGAHFLVGVSDKGTEGLWLDSNGQNLTDSIKWKNGLSNNEEGLDQLIADGSLLQQGIIEAFYATNESDEHGFSCIKIE